MGNTTYKNIPDISSEVNTGDLISFAGRTALDKFIVGPITHSKETHIGMVLKNNDQTFILESHLYNYNYDNFLRKVMNGGVNIVPLMKRLRKHGGRARIFKLNKNLRDVKYTFVHESGKRETLNGEQIVWKFYEKNKNKRYDYFYPFNIISTKLDTRYYFCSEMVARIYKILKILPEAVQENKVVPGTFKEWKDSMDRGKSVFANDFKFKNNVTSNDFSINNVLIY